MTNTKIMNETTKQGAEGQGDVPMAEGGEEPATAIPDNYKAARVLLVDSRGHFVLGQVGKNRSKGS